LGTDIERVFLVYAGGHITASPPLGILYLSSVLEAVGIHTDVFDLAVRPDFFPVLLDRCRKTPPRWVGFSCITPEMPIVVQYIRQFREHFSDIPIGIGGIHPSFLPEDSLKETNADFVVIGEGEGRVVSITERIARGDLGKLYQIPGVGIRFNGEVKINAEKAPLVDFASLPFPNWKKINLSDYDGRHWQLMNKRNPAATVTATRGCPYSCSFCAVPKFMGRKIRKRNVDSVLDEIEQLVREFGVREIHFADDTFNAELVYAKQILKGIIDRNLDIVWKCPEGVRIDRWDDEWIDLAKKSGCYRLCFGIESLDQDVLAKNDKSLKIEGINEVLKKYRDKGISTLGFFIFGLPGDTKKGIKRTIRKARSLQLDYGHVSLCVPVPGSVLFEKYSKKDDYDRNWAHYRLYEWFPLSGLSEKRLKSLMRRFYFTFYSKPKRFFGLLKDARGSVGIWKLFVIFLTFTRRRRDPS